MPSYRDCSIAPPLLHSVPLLIPPTRPVLLLQVPSPP
jgi:hypothetical protein